MTLPVLIDMHEDETPESRANRLSSANGFSSFDRFLAMMAINRRGLSAGSEECITRLPDGPAPTRKLCRNMLPLQCPARGLGGSATPYSDRTLVGVSGFATARPASCMTSRPPAVVPFPALTFGRHGFAARF